MTQAISKEIRWFLGYDKIQPIKDWFERFTPLQKLGGGDFYPRQDYYLSIPGAKNLGIKIREPKKDEKTGKMKTALEVKQQISGNIETELASGYKGMTNEWKKISYELLEGEKNVLSVDFSFPSDKNWLRVDKDRIIVKYDAENRAIKEPNAFLNEACGIELTKIKIQEKVYYSLGLEAFSKSGNRLDTNFSTCCDFVFNSIRVEGLNSEQSLSYPEFLTGFM